MAGIQMDEPIVMITSIFGMMLIPVIAMILNSMMEGPVPEDRKNEARRTIAVPNRTEIDRTGYMTRGNPESSFGAVDDSVERSKYDVDLGEPIP